MTGGSEQAEDINRRLATAAQEMGVAMGVGSQRVAFEQPELAKTFKVRDYAPDVLLFANLGAVQLNYGYSVEHCQQAVDMIDADGLILHINALQEAVQPEGDTRFSGLLNKIEQVCYKISVPVIAKEVGWGFSGEDARQLADAGVSAIDIAGAGGTSWTAVEMYRAQNESQARLAATFLNWGIPTAESIQQVRKATPEMTIFASGGLRTGLDIAKCIALGAKLGGMASPFLKAASQSTEDVIVELQQIEQEIKVSMFAAGIRDITQLSKSPLVETL
jgi:isopentenyl-diphosphate delta-isomerase